MGKQPISKVYLCPIDKKTEMVRFLNLYFIICVNFNFFQCQLNCRLSLFFKFFTLFNLYNNNVLKFTKIRERYNQYLCIKKTTNFTLRLWVIKLQCYVHSMFSIENLTKNPAVTLGFINIQCLN